MNDDEDDWDDICVNPHDASVMQGRAEGRQAGEEAGYREGWDLGQTTAVEYGMELGFIRGVIETLSVEENGKAARTLRDLRRALEKFPDAQDIFRDQQTVSSNDRTAQTTTTHADDDDDDTERPATEGEENARQLIQRIRSRFRLLVVQLQMPHLSLKESLNTKRADDDSAARDRQQSTTDW